MIEVLPIKALHDEDGPIFGRLNVLLSKLASLDLAVAGGIVVTPPNLKLKTTLEQYNFSTYEVIEQSLVLVKKDLEKIPVPDILIQEIGEHGNFLVGAETVKGANQLWTLLISNWIEDLKALIWRRGFAPGITENLESQVVIFTKNLVAFGKTGIDNDGEVTISILQGKLEAGQLKELDELVERADKKLIIPYEFSWILDSAIKLSGIRPYTPPNAIPTEVGRSRSIESGVRDSSAQRLARNDELKSAVKLFLDLSVGEVPQTDFEGSYLIGEKLYDLNKPGESFDNLVLKLAEVGSLDKPVLLKLADKSEGMGKVRGTLRLLHQKSLLDSFTEAINFVRENRTLFNIHMVLPFVRGISEFNALKRELALKKLTRGNLVQIWMEVAVPENIINLEEYIVAGLDGLVFNLDELLSHLSGFDLNEQELLFYKKDAKALLNFLGDGFKLAHKLKVPVVAYGSVILYPEVLEFMVENGVYGVVVERYEADAGKSLLQKMEKKLILKRAS